MLNDKNLVKVNFESEEQRKRLVHILYDKLYERFIREIDAIDNGIDIADEKRYDITTNLSARVGGLNPAWNQTNLNENVSFLNLIKKNYFHLFGLIKQKKYFFYKD